MARYDAHVWTPDLSHCVVVVNETSTVGWLRDEACRAFGLDADAQAGDAALVALDDGEEYLLHDDVLVLQLLVGRTPAAGGALPMPLMLRSLPVAPAGIRSTAGSLAAVQAAALSHGLDIVDEYVYRRARTLWHLLFRDLPAAHQTPTSAQLAMVLPSSVLLSTSAKMCWQQILAARPLEREASLSVVLVHAARSYVRSIHCLLVLCVDAIELRAARTFALLRRIDLRRARVVVHANVLGVDEKVDALVGGAPAPLAAGAPAFATQTSRIDAAALEDFARSPIVVAVRSASLAQSVASSIALLLKRLTASAASQASGGGGAESMAPTVLESAHGDDAAAAGPSAGATMLSAGQRAASRVTLTTDPPAFVSGSIGRSAAVTGPAAEGLASATPASARVPSSERFSSAASGSAAAALTLSPAGAAGLYGESRHAPPGRRADRMLADFAQASLGAGDSALQQSHSGGSSASANSLPGVHQAPPVQTAMSFLTQSQAQLAAQADAASSGAVESLRRLQSEMDRLRVAIESATAAGSADSIGRARDMRRQLLDLQRRYHSELRAFTMST